MRGHGTLQAMLGRTSYVTPKRKRDDEEAYLQAPLMQQKAMGPVPTKTPGQPPKTPGFDPSRSNALPNTANTAHKQPAAMNSGNKSRNGTLRPGKGKKQAVSSQPAWDWTANKPKSKASSSLQTTPSTSAKQPQIGVPSETIDLDVDDLEETLISNRKASSTLHNTSSTTPPRRPGPADVDKQAYVFNNSNSSRRSPAPTTYNVSSSPGSGKKGMFRSPGLSPGAQSQIRVFEMVCPVMGRRHRGGLAEATCLSVVNNRTSLTVKLQREPDNPVDPNAVQIVVNLHSLPAAIHRDVQDHPNLGGDVQGHEDDLIMIGHIPGRAAEILAPLLDQNQITVAAKLQSRQVQETATSIVNGAPDLKRDEHAEPAVAPSTRSASGSGEPPKFNRATARQPSTAALMATLTLEMTCSVDTASGLSSWQRRLVYEQLTSAQEACDESMALRDSGKILQDKFLIMAKDLVTLDRHVFSEDELRLMSHLQGLPHDQLCLLLRLFLRKGPWFTLRELEYREVEDPEATGTALVHQSLLLPPRKGQCQELLAALPAYKLMEVSSHVGVAGLAASSRREQMCKELTGHCSCNPTPQQLCMQRSTSLDRPLDITLPRRDSGGGRPAADSSSVPLHDSNQTINHTHVQKPVVQEICVVTEGASDAVHAVTDHHDDSAASPAAESPRLVSLTTAGEHQIQSPFKSAQAWRPLDEEDLQGKPLPQKDVPTAMQDADQETVPAAANVDGQADHHHHHHAHHHHHHHHHQHETQHLEQDHSDHSEGNNKVHQEPLTYKATEALQSNQPLTDAQHGHIPRPRGLEAQNQSKLATTLSHRQSADGATVLGTGRTSSTSSLQAKRSPSDAAQLPVPGNAVIGGDTAVPMYNAHCPLQQSVYNVVGPMVRLHPGVVQLIRRMQLIYLLDPTADLNKWVGSEKGALKYPPYKINRTRSAFPTRQAFLDYEAALALAGHLEQYMTAGDMQSAERALQPAVDALRSGLLHSVIWQGYELSTPGLTVLATNGTAQRMSTHGAATGREGVKTETITRRTSSDLRNAREIDDRRTHHHAMPQRRVTETIVLSDSDGGEEGDEKVDTCSAVHPVPDTVHVPEDLQPGCVASVEMEHDTVKQEAPRTEHGAHQSVIAAHREAATVASCCPELDQNKRQEECTKGTPNYDTDMIADGCNIQDNASAEAIQSDTGPPPLFLAQFCAAWPYAVMCNAGVSQYEKARRYDEAIKLLRDLLSTPCTPATRGEWWRRLCINLEHQGRDDDALAAAEAAIADPWVKHGELLGLQRRVVRLGKPPRRWKKPAWAAAVQREPPEVVIVGRPINSSTGAKSRFYTNDGRQVGVEQLALEYYASEEGGEWKGDHCEGGVWANLAGMLLWDVLFSDTVPDVFRTPFQTAPLDLGTPTFYLARKQLVDQRLNEIASGNAEKILANTWQRYKGYWCRGVSWDRHSLEELQEIARCIGGLGLSVVARMLAEDYNGWRGGMPDLLLWRPDMGDAKLSEVKGPRDRLSDSQRAWMQALLNAGVQCEVLRVQEPKLTQGKKRGR